MAKQEHLRILEQGVGAWNTWRAEHPEIKPDLSHIYVSDCPFPESLDTSLASS